MAKAKTGRLQGLITFLGEIPKSPVADDAGVRRPILHVDRETRGLQDVVVWLKPAEGSPPANVAPARMDQRDHEFVPRVLAVHAGQPVQFSNSDLANHNVRTTSLQPTNEFNVFTGTDGSYTHRFAAEPGHRPVRVGCDIHPWMRGWIYVFEHPYFAVTDDRGRFQMSELPEGRYQLEFQQPDLHCAGARPVVISNAQPATVHIAITAASIDQPNK